MRLKILSYLIMFAQLYHIPVFAQSFDIRNDWFGQYNGITDFKLNGKSTQKNCSFRLMIPAKIPTHLKNKFVASRSYTSNQKYATLFIPENYSNIKRLTITKSIIKITASNKYPFDIDIKKTKDKYGDLKITGYIKYYKLTSSGKLVKDLDYSPFTVY